MPPQEQQAAKDNGGSSPESASSPAAAKEDSAAVDVIHANGTRIRKHFPHPDTGVLTAYDGTVIGFEKDLLVSTSNSSDSDDNDGNDTDTGDYYLVEFDDGDQEHIQKADLEQLLVLQPVVLEEPQPQPAQQEEQEPPQEEEEEQVIFPLQKEEEEEEENHNDFVYPNGTRIRKLFDTPDGSSFAFYDGTVLLLERDLLNPETGETGDYYFCRFDDGDEEHIARSELQLYVDNFTENVDVRSVNVEMEPKNKPAAVVRKKKRTKKKTAPAPAGAAAAKKRRKQQPPPKRRPVAKMSYSDDDDDMEVEAVDNKTKKRSSRARTSTRRVVDHNSDDDDDSEALDDKKPAAKKSRSSQKVNSSKEPVVKATTTRGGRSVKKVYYGDDPDDEDDDEDDSSDAESSEACDVDESESDLDNDIVFDEEEDDDLLGEDDDELVEEEERPAKKNNKKKKQPAAAAAAAKKPKGKKLCESFTPINNPVYYNLSQKEIDETKQYLDPCGMEATDDIIDKKIGEQVETIGGLMQRAFSSGKMLGSAADPLRLGTACSGTDSPALAMTLVQEQMELRGIKKQAPAAEGNGSNANNNNNQDDPSFHFEHQFSCENEPFKQAYLARNFDSDLYPDITRLVDEEDDDYVPCDVYGQSRPLSDFNVFVAGTSCKNFSMLRSKFRIDIEDKGCSGETFLAACQVLFKHQPDYAIFENVKNAPWEKMREYITGRIKLSNCSSTKSIKENKTKDRELEFVRDGNKIVVDFVPAVYGVRCGAVVKGYVTGDSTEVHAVSWPRKTKRTGKCLLAELIQHNGISKANDTLVFETECTYCAHYINVDTKEFGLPQTRNRVYMFVWKPHNNNVYDDLGEYWAALVNKLKSPCRHSLDAFLLSEDHDIVRVFREALNGPPGRQSKHDCFTEPYFWTSASANVAHCSYPREALSLGQEARWLTNWHAFGKKQLPPSFWLEYANMFSQRKCDMLDILNASAIRDSQSKDPLWSPYCWNLSQNASKEKHTGAVPAIASCLSPGGEVFLPHKGRPLLGVEKLIIQGLPYFRLLLGSESEVQLGDLAGNAMTLTVVSATMLAAMTCRQLREETISQCKSKDPNKLAATRDKILKSHCGLETDKTVAAVDIDRMSAQGDMSDALCLFTQLASLAEAAVQTSVWCTCETSGKNSSSESFLQCRDCQMSCCRNCVSEQAGFNLATHALEEVVVDSKDHAVGAFQTRLRNLLPPSLVISDEGWKELSSLDGDRFRVKSLAGSQFHLHRIKRDRKRWIILYYSRDGVCGECVAELRLLVGEIERRTPTDLGLCVEFKSFQPARTEPRVYGLLEPCAKLVMLTGCSERTDPWKGKSSSKQIPVYVQGSGSTDSLRVEVGLDDNVADVIREAANGKKHFNEAKKLGEERRWLYPNNWKAWPETITLTAECDLDMDFSGVYCRANCRQTTNQSALWIRKATETSHPLYILIQPEVSRTGPDIAVVSRSLDHGDVSAVIAVFPRSWQPCDALSPTGKIETFTIPHWTDLSQMACKVPRAKLAVSGGDPESDTLVSINGLSKSQVEMLARYSSPEASSISLNVHSGQNAQQIVRVFNAVCVAALLQFVASSDFQYDLTPNASWSELTTSSGEVAFGHCEASVPVRPVEKWVFDDVRKAWERRSRPHEARRYYLKLEEAPRAFEFLLNRASHTLDVKYNPRIVAHQAAAKLIRNRGQEIEQGALLAQFRLADVSLQSDPVINPFSVPNCNKEEVTNISLNGNYKLYERQQKVVTAMLNIEAGKQEFEELEISESAMPGSSGLTLIAKASRKTTIRGGVIADAIGSGKTVVSIAIILAGLEKARASRCAPRKSGATLVLVPPALIKQWEDEIEKFARGLNVVTIFDQGSLQSQTLQGLRDKADVVICNIDILTSTGSKNPHLSHLLTCAQMDDAYVDVPTLPHHAPQKEVSAARGTWVPYTSQDPYAGANNPLSQRRRNQSAYHTHIYHQAITEVRKLTFRDNDSVPLEYLEWERIIVDEVHETLCTTKSELDLSKAKAANDKNNGTGFYQEKNRRAGRELLGITQRDVSRRPLVCRGVIFGLTGTPLLDSSDRVTELATMMGGLYVTGLFAHWRKLERESVRDIFLHNYLEPKPSRETRSTIHAQCQAFLDVCCCRNRVAEAEMEGIQLKTHTNVVQMSHDEEALYLQSQAGIPTSKRSLGIKPEDFDDSAGHDIHKFLRQNAKLESRGGELVKIVKGILEKDPTTKIIVFADGGIGAGIAARDFLQNGGLGCTWMDPQNDSVKTMNKKIGWYQRGDATEEDCQRPRVLVLHFEHAAGLNLQQECYNLILFTPLYKGVGGASSDAVADTSTELQAIGRVMRIGQLHPQVNVFRIEVRGPEGQECLDGQLIRRNTDEETIAMAVNAGDDEKPSQ